MEERYFYIDEDEVVKTTNPEDSNFKSDYKKNIFQMQIEDGDTCFTLIGTIKDATKLELVDDSVDEAINAKVTTAHSYNTTWYPTNCKYKGYLIEYLPCYKSNVDGGIISVSFRLAETDTYKAGTIVGACSMSGVYLEDEVEEIPITGIHFNQQYFTIELGTPDKLLPVIEPENTTMDKTLTWTCSETATATVAQDGTVTGVGYNDTYYTTITATTVNGLSASYKLGVMPQGTLHKHSWAASWSSNTSHHWHDCTATNCSITNNTQKDGYAAHVFDDDQDPTCNICGYVRIVEAPEHVHNWENTWSSSTTHHWHECAESGCSVTDNSQKDGYSNHVFDDDQDAVCNVCGYIRTVEEHIHDWYAFDASPTIAMVTCNGCNTTKSVSRPSADNVTYESTKTVVDQDHIKFNITLTANDDTKTLTDIIVESAENEYATGIIDDYHYSVYSKSNKTYLKVYIPSHYLIEYNIELHEWVEPHVHEYGPEDSSRVIIDEDDYGHHTIYHTKTCTNTDGNCTEPTVTREEYVSCDYTIPNGKPYYSNGNVYQTFMCICGSWTTKKIDHEHEYTWTVTTEPTCTEPGVATYTCSCGHTYTEAISPGHSFEEREEIISTKDVCTQTIRSCTKCDYSEVIEVNSTHKFRITSEGEQLECRICGYDPEEEEEMIPKPIVSINDSMKVEGANANLYTFDLDFGSMLDSLGQVDTSEVIEGIKIEVDTENPNSTYELLEYKEELGGKSVLSYTDPSDNIYFVKYKTRLEAPKLYMDLKGEDVEGNSSEVVSIVLDDSFSSADPIIPDEPVDPSECNCTGDYKILVEIKPATVNQPAQYQYLSVSNEVFETSSLKEGVNKYCKELDNYKRKQITLVDIVDVNIDLTIKNNTEEEPKHTCPNCGANLD